MGRERVSMYERTRQNDIPYRGPFSYRHLRIIGWITASILLFAIILDRKLSYAHLIGQYAILTAVVVVLFELFVEHYAIVPDGLTGEELIIAVADKLRIVTGWGFGKHMALIGVIPFIMLFSYNRNHRNLLADTLIPVGGVILAVLVGLETVYRALMVAMPTITAALSEIMTEAEAMMP